MHPCVRVKGASLLPVLWSLVAKQECFATAGWEACATLRYIALHTPWQRPKPLAAFWE